jgi:hypothetical protein
VSVRSWLLAAGFLVLSLLLMRSVLVIPYLPTNDGPEHVLGVHVEDHYGDPGTLYRDAFVPAPGFASRGFSLVFGPLKQSLGWERGLAVTLAVIALLTAGGTIALVRAVDARRSAIAFLGFPLALTWELYMGFFPFAVASAFGLFVLALALKWHAPGGLGRALLAVLLLLEAVGHVFAAILTGIVIAVVTVTRAPRGKRLRELGLVVLTGLPAAGILVLAVIVSRSAGAKIPFAEHFLNLPIAVSLGAFPRLAAPGPLWRALVFLGVLAAGLALAILRQAGRAVPLTDLTLLIVGVGFLLLGAFAPLHVPGWQFFAPRFVPLGLLLCLSAVPLETCTRRGAGPIVGALAFALSASWLHGSAAFHRRLRDSAADAIDGLAAPVQRHALWLPVTLAPQGGLPLDPPSSEVPYLTPLRHMPALYEVVEGGLVPSTFATNAATYSFVARPNGLRLPPIPPAEHYMTLMESDAFELDATLRRRIEDELATYGMFYEGVLVTGARPSDVAQWRSRGYMTDWAQGSVLIAHFVPCPLAVVVQGASEAPLLDVGIGDQTIFRDESLPLVVGEGASQLRLPRSPCGDVWVRPHWTMKHDDRTEQPIYCGNAGNEGRIAATITWSSARVECAIPATEAP